MATTLSKGNPGTVSLWRRILEMFPRLEAMKINMGVRYVSISIRRLFPTQRLGGARDSLQSAVSLNGFQGLSAPPRAQQSTFHSPPGWADQPPMLIPGFREQILGGTCYYRQHHEPIVVHHFTFI